MCWRCSASWRRRARYSLRVTLAVRGAFLALLFAVGMAVGSLARPATGLHGRYYTNLTRNGPPIADTIDQEVSTSALGNGQARVWIQFSAEWDGFVLIDRPGPYNFATMSDDGSELEIDGQVIVRNGGLHGMQLAS